ncbi:hypothetical protein [Variovorax saccharolyticus]|uniref:hypothetical protein n=1 Tax=Variovorax saccharolyticus TaxID=3053516 RepID=UPI0025783C9F|nr:hypothetical protein [Variovorax sp. J22R187]MDM0019210.1 hypothetical protein [Variovorax sp. J22R187]
MSTAATVSLWAGVVVIGIYHGLNPAMGWPLAVANGLGARRGGAVFATWVPLGAGHLLAMALVLVPFALLTWMMERSLEIRVGAGVLVLLYGLSRLLVRQRHRHSPLVRIRSTQVAFWSFLMASGHGAALMLLPVLLGLCETPAATAAGGFDRAAAMDLMRASVGTAVVVSLVHTAAMIASGLAVGWVVYRYLGLRALRAQWIDLDIVWALGLIVSGSAGVATALLAYSSR